MMRHKKAIAAAAAIVATLFVSVGGTVAYFQYAQSTKNQLTIGENAITIHEDYAPPKEMEAGENVYKKDVKVKNTGAIPCFIRVYAAFSDSAIMEKSELSPDGSSFISAKTYSEHLPDDWEYISEADDALLGGYYYYTEPVNAGNETDSLFKKVKTTFERAEDVQSYEIIVYAESVQTLDKDGREFQGSKPWKSAWTEFLERR